MVSFFISFLVLDEEGDSADAPDLDDGDVGAGAGGEALLAAVGADQLDQSVLEAVGADPD
ncbi:hypothetical protein Sjap_015198 [Stephania japonica]|uniref:Uncharacterized protein n=1 Tax=Stephania japonica TaxID=461633 RepID=A0AAP0IK96_9MAGN